MNEIEKIQNEIGAYLIDMIPVPWKKICFYAECSIGCTSTWIAFIEKKTGVISTQEFFWKRYNSYPFKELDVNMTLAALSQKLFEAYIEKFGEDKVWRTMFYTIEEDYSFNIDFEHELPKGNFVEAHHAVFRKFFNSEYDYIEGKYPY